MLSTTLDSVLFLTGLSVHGFIPDNPSSVPVDFLT